MITIEVIDQRRTTVKSEPVEVLSPTLNGFPFDSAFLLFRVADKGVGLYKCTSTGCER